MKKLLVFAISLSFSCSSIASAEYPISAATLDNESLSDSYDSPLTEEVALDDLQLCKYKFVDGSLDVTWQWLVCDVKFTCNWEGVPQGKNGECPYQCSRGATTEFKREVGRVPCYEIAALKGEKLEEYINKHCNKSGSPTGGQTYDPKVPHGFIVSCSHSVYDD
jgi:hypothetical protein